jgi:hypothetical protein
MGLKTIFQEGMKERKRKKSLGKVNHEFKEKEKTLSTQLTALGQKTWEAKADLSAYPDLKAALLDAQKVLDDLRVQAEQLQKQKQGDEAKKKRENERLNAAIKEAEEKKREVDKRLNDQKNTMQTGQKEIQRATNRLAAIVSERAQLQNKNANPAAAETEKQEIAKGLDSLSREEEELQAGINGWTAAGKPIAALVSAFQEESNELQKQIENLRSEQKKTIAEIDKIITALNNDLSKNSEKTKEGESRQKLDFKRLGEKLAEAKSADPVIAKEMAAVINARTEMEGVQALIGGLERQKDASQVSAYKKMMAILIGGIILLAAIVIVLFILLSPKKKESPFGALGGDAGAAVQSMENLAQQMQKGLGGIKAESEKMQGEKITVASESTLKSVLPELGGWQLQNPYYNAGTYDAMEIASLQADYAGLGGDSVRFQVTDAGTASALLAPLKMVFSMNLRIDDKDVMQQTSTINGIPVVERIDKHDKEATFGIIYKDRYLIELKTKAEKGLELLREFAAKLDLSGLGQ